MESKTSKFTLHFISQFAGAFVDNFFKTVLITLITFKSIQLGGLDSASLIALASALFILPFFLFSYFAGDLSDRLSKTRVLFYCKILEFCIVTVAALALLGNHYEGLLISLFLLGVQAAFFGPAKYSVLPEFVLEKDLHRANGWIESSTFVAILLGTTFGGMQALKSPTVILLTLYVSCLLGLFASGLLLFKHSGTPHLPSAKIKAWSKSLALWKKLPHPELRLSLLLISLFWLIGAGILTLIPLLAKETLHGNEMVLTWFLSLFTVGIGLGALLADRVQKKWQQAKVIQWCYRGFTLSLFLVFVIHRSLGDSTPETPLLSVVEVLKKPWVLGLSMLVLLISILGGIWTVPLYTKLLTLSSPAERSQVIALNNVFNAGFMVAISLIFMVIFAFGFSHSYAWLALCLMALGFDKIVKKFK